MGNPEIPGDNKNPFEAEQSFDAMVDRELEDGDAGTNKEEMASLDAKKAQELADAELAEAKKDTGIELTQFMDDITGGRVETVEGQEQIELSTVGTSTDNPESFADAAGDLNSVETRDNINFEGGDSDRLAA